MITSAEIENNFLLYLVSLSNQYTIFEYQRFFVRIQHVLIIRNVIIINFSISCVIENFIIKGSFLNYRIVFHNQRRILR